VVEQEISADMKLHDYITARMEQPFAWGVNDCILFAVGWAELATEKKYIPEVTWSNEKEALQVLKDLGGMIAAFDRNFSRIEPSFARDGDLAIVDETAYLFSGPHIVGVGKAGLIFKNRTEASCAYSY
jgi:hypothetical protein